MVKRGLGLRFGVVGSLMIASVGGCGTTPENEIPPPDIDLISVFYPVDGLVHGIGLPGAISATVDRVLIRAHPTDTSKCEPVDKDGGFNFTLVAVDDDILEITAALGSECEVRGGPAFMRVPLSPLPPPDYVCCLGNSKCQTVQRAETEEDCPDLGRTCEDDRDCGPDEGELLEIDENAISVTAPDANGIVTITGSIQYPQALVRVKNLGLSPLGHPSPGTRQAVVANDKGQFVFDRLGASADDELSIQVEDLNGFRSPPLGMRVPDPDLAGVDIIGIYPQEDLGGGERGPLAIHIAPYGVDGRGFCPDQTENGVLTPRESWICYTGGIAHDMVTIKSAVIDGTTDAAMTPSKTSSVTQPFNTGTLGEIRQVAKDIVVVLDMTELAVPSEAERGLQVNAAKQLLDRLPSRDRVGVIAMRDYDTGDVLTLQDAQDSGLRSIDGRTALKSAMDALVTTDFVPGSTSGAMEGIALAGDILRRVGTREGRVVLITRAAPSTAAEKGMDPIEDFSDRYGRAYDGVVGNPLTGVASYPTYVVGFDFLVAANPSDNKFSDMESIIDFSSGRFYQTVLEDLDVTLTSVLQALSGSFILLYDANVPCKAGNKLMTVDLSLDLQLVEGGPVASTSFSGPVRIARQLCN